MKQPVSRRQCAGVRGGGGDALEQIFGVEFARHSRHLPCMPALQGSIVCAWGAFGWVGQGAGLILVDSFGLDDVAAPSHASGVVFFGPWKKGIKQPIPTIPCAQIVASIYTESMGGVAVSQYS